MELADRRDPCDRKDLLVSVERDDATERAERTEDLAVRPDAADAAPSRSSPSGLTRMSEAAMDDTGRPGGSLDQVLPGSSLSQQVNCEAERMSQRLGNLGENFGEKGSAKAQFALQHKAFLSRDTALQRLSAELAPPLCEG
eukprot:CAMPEP_0175890062 /NCGR_PEP_ID=MMETSP0107_2-20121207/47616_1 /TAXON_ID=195067 ORGANISM="Goniomonas pacifica, Strain CCMP1869" /NCGR_SAMPLE_ID=MMETSP0107_2 /ASSEMBLY_ACC=CAM_ASM_000203 /LENGTH=140 /DNA_ID=CAMNT_0017210779 /DNA_START=85 /DNA_END=508 /DNA_ORIENTATION=+